MCIFTLFYVICCVGEREWEREEKRNLSSLIHNQGWAIVVRILDYLWKLRKEEIKI